jgi:serine/threonine protein kinase/formylglycine-generating enzyme required for sulfatase activity
MTVMSGEPQSDGDQEIGIETLIAQALSRIEARGDRGLDEIARANPERAAELRDRIEKLRQRGLVARSNAIEIDGYRILRTLGRGGMGEVFLAEQIEPIRRLVAVKVLRGDMVDAASLQRFVAEREALSRMEHPGIARILDAGSTAHDVPYLVMEYVQGQPITEWCDSRRLDLPARLTLLAEVCDAVQHAHQHGILHRDLKPSNVLVRQLDGDAEAKVIDFGLAKSFGQSALGCDPMTLTGQVLGTPAYMSPEQAGASASAVDSRTDVYALGVMAYELCVGVLPFDEDLWRRGGPLEMFRLVREVEPPIPSVRAARLTEAIRSSIAKQRGMHSGSTVIRRLRGEIDWIIRRAMAKSPRDRYASVSELAADLRRFLAGQPVLAGPPTAIYRLRTFVRRHPLGTAVVSSLSVAAIVVLGVILRLGGEARESLLKFDRLAARQSVADLLREADDDLWPIRPSTLPAMDDWLRRARDLAQTVAPATLRAEIAALEHRRSTLPPNEHVLLDGLRELIADVERLAGRKGAIDAVTSRRELVGAMVERTVVEARAAWAAARESLRNELSFELAPIVGLIPIGRDPDSHRYEFVVATPGGRTPQRDDRGRLPAPAPLDDPILVLIPAASRVPVGNQSDDRGQPHFDSDRGADETTLQYCDLDAFLIGKHEITQAQWLRVMGSTPAVFAPDGQAGRAVGVQTTTHPIESISFAECLAFCTRLGLEIPSEPQWEYAARAGSDTPYLTGSDPSSLAGLGNFADKARADRYSLTSGCDEQLDDGFAVHAPIGTFAANAFGLHDVLGNVWEWCRSFETPWPTSSDRAELVQPYCGGSFATHPVKARFNAVQAEQGINRKHVIGFRAARTLGRP